LQGDKSHLSLQVKDYLLRVLDKFKPSNEIDEKVKLLNEDQNLYQMYKDLVVGGAISAEEFWANRNVCFGKVIIIIIT